ncbi:hypothetical protein GCM10009107_64100 [Ideonella azotifigens]|uniref:Type II secretion system protein GspC N-terminal domain-containing protein n=2 Tax=Ideonella azotifigens TaxID=513160 RepID=A0ABN1KN41_9BURK
MVLSEATRDPFYPDASAPTGKPAKPAAQPTPQALAPANIDPPPPQAPPMTHRVLGRFAGPDGARLLFVQDGQQAVVAAPGVELSSGYRIEAITATEIRLRHPLLMPTVSLPLPAEAAP